MAFLFMVLLILLCIGFICIPIAIANARGITGGEHASIVLLSWLGIFFGVTWIVALILACVWHGDKNTATDNLDKLEQLSRLYKSKAISKSEYEKMKRKLMGE